MSEPTATLPKVEERHVIDLLKSLGLPAPLSVSQLRVAAEYHSIYVVAIPGKNLILRVAANHIPHIKTKNEIAVMRWVRQHTEIPLPRIIAFDASDDNAISHEFTLLEEARGTSIDKIYDSLTEQNKQYIVEQLTDFIIALHKQPFNHVGGLCLDKDGAVGPGPVVEVRSWQTPEVEKAWGASETVDSLNARGPFASWTEYGIARARSAQFALERHPLLVETCKALHSRVDRLIEAVIEERSEIDNCSYVLAHKDLHLANVMCEPSTCKITAVLDWEFSQVVPLPAWNPGNFLWNGKTTDTSQGEQGRLMELFKTQCQRRGVADSTLVEMNDLQAALQDAIEYVNWVVRDTALQRPKQRIEQMQKGLDEALEEFKV